MKLFPSFPLVRLPMRVAFVDDSTPMLQAMRTTVAHAARRQFFDSPFAALEILEQDIQNWDAVGDLLYQCFDADEGTRLPLLAARYFNCGQRFCVTTALVIDYAMPGMSGLELASKLAGYAGSTLLLTGEAGPSAAVNGFNAGLIEKYLTKAECAKTVVLEAALEELYLHSCRTFSAGLSGSFSREQLDFLSHPTVANALCRVSMVQGWVEHIVVPRPFGILGMRTYGPPQWMQIENEASLLELQGLALSPSSANAPDVDARFHERQIQRASELSAYLGNPLLLSPQPEVCLCKDPLLVVSTWDLPIPAISSSSWGEEVASTTSEFAQTLLAQLCAAHEHERAAARESYPGIPATVLQAARNMAADSVREASKRIRTWYKDSRTRHEALWSAANGSQSTLEYLRRLTAPTGAAA
jgi:CheY-like chemotaxis protein